VWAWGDNTFGHLGNGVVLGSFQASPIPTLETNIAGVVAVAAGSDHTIALTADRRVWTWGSNGSGQLGRSTAGTFDAVPGQVTNLSGVAAIAGGDRFTVAMTTNGQVYAWGLNDSGQLGTNGPDIPTPHLVTGISNAVAVSAHSFGQASSA